MLSGAAQTSTKAPQLPGLRGGPSFCVQLRVHVAVQPGHVPHSQELSSPVDRESHSMFCVWKEIKGVLDSHVRDSGGQGEVHNTQVLTESLTLSFVFSRIQAVLQFA